MRNLIVLISAILLLACSVQKNNSTRNTSSKNTSKVKEMYGRVVVHSLRSDKGDAEKPVLYFDNGVTYLINFTESRVSETELQNKIQQKIGVLGEIKVGETPNASQYINKEKQFVKEGKYIVIYKVL